ncbi:MAG: hypothetical protein ACYC4U_02405 [Pirellulaceae bacterium]
MWLCDSCPSPEQIDQRAAEVRSTWTDDMHVARHWDCSVSRVRWRQQYHLDDHVCTIGRLE